VREQLSSVTNVECSCRWRRRTGCRHNVAPRLDETCSSQSRPCLSRYVSSTRQPAVLRPDSRPLSQQPCITHHSHRNILDALVFHCTTNDVVNTNDYIRHSLVVHCYKQGRINHSGAPSQRKAGTFSHTRSQDFLDLGVHFSFLPQKVDELFSRRRYV